MLYHKGDKMFVSGTPLPLKDILLRVASLPINRRAVAGGFMENFSFRSLREKPLMEGFDVEDWVLDVFAQVTPEPYLPSAQSFWFHVHEAFCTDPAFVGRMIDAGHLWEALMTATEIQDRVDGMEPILKRLAACDEPSIATSAKLCLERHYTIPQ